MNKSKGMTLHAPSQWTGEPQAALNGTVTWLVLILIFLNPFPHTTFFDQVLFYTALIPAIVLVIRYDKQVYCRSRLFYPLCGYLAWSVVTAFFALDRAESFHDLYSHLVRYLMFYGVLINFFQTRQRLVWISVCIVISEAVFASGMLIYQYGILGHDIHSRLGYGFSAVSIDIMPFGFIMAGIVAGWLLTLPLRTVQKCFLAGALLVLLAATIFTHSRGAVLALGMALPILFWKHKKMLLIIGAASIVLILQTPLKERIKPDQLFEDAPRKALICYSIEIIKDYPVWGTGFSIDTFRNGDLIDRKIYSSRLPDHLQGKVSYLWPHNMLLHMGVRTGILGMIVYSSLFVVSAYMCLRLILYGRDPFVKKHARCCLSLIVMFAANGMLQPVFIHFLDTVFFMILAMVTIAWRIQEDVQASDDS